MTQERELFETLDIRQLACGGKKMVNQRAAIRQH